MQTTYVHGVGQVTSQFSSPDNRSRRKTSKHFARKIRRETEKDKLLVHIRYKKVTKVQNEEKIKNMIQTNKTLLVKTTRDLREKFVGAITKVSERLFFKVFKNEVECISSDLNTKMHPFELSIKLNRE